MWVLLAAAAAAAPCEQPVALEVFRGTLELGWQDLQNGAAEDARRKLVSLTQSIGCLEAPLTPEDAAHYQRIRAVDAYTAGDENGARAAARATARLAPDAVEGWAQQVPTLGTLLPIIDIPDVTEEFGTALAGLILVDGAEVPRRHVGQPLIVQVFDPSGRPLHGAWVDSRDPLPDWVAFPEVACPLPSSIPDLLRQSAAAESAYVQLDVPEFNRALRAVAAGLPCLPAKVSTQQAAVVHRLEGLRLYTLGADAAALRSFQQAHALDPRYTPPETVMRPGSALAELWGTATRAASASWMSARIPDGVALVVDGTPTASRPAALPSIVQVATPSGEILWTRYVPANVALPDLGFLGQQAARLAEAALPPGERRYLELSRKRSARNRRIGLVLGGAMALTGSALLFSQNVELSGRYFDSTTPQDQLGALRRDTNLTATTSSVLLVGSVGLFGAAIVLP